MDAKRYILKIIILYSLVILLILVLKETSITFLLILALMLFHIFGFSGEREKLNQNNEDSLKKVLSKLSKTQKESQDSYRRFISLTKTLGSGLMMVNEDGAINFANKDFNQYFSFENNYKNYNSLLKIKPLYKFVNQAYLLEKSSREQIQYLEKHYDLVSTPIFENDVFQGCLILVHDITNLKTAESFQKQFTADVSHELKTPLSTIKGFSEILVRDVEMEKKDRIEFITLINRESIRMESILSDLLIIAKMDRLDYELNLQEINIKDLILESVDSLKYKINNKNLKCNIEAQDCILDLDKNKMGQVIINLVRNAINYTDKGKINIDGRIDREEYILQVRDTGIGIDKDNFENIFKRFYRVDTARSRDSGGSGLGLSICKNVVLKHSGKITVNSKRNEGTTFQVILNIKKK